MSDMTRIGSHRRGATGRETRVLEILGHAKVGGMERSVQGLIGALPRERFAVSCVVPYESAYAAELRRAGHAAAVIPLADDPYWRSIQAVADLVRRERIDVLHAHLPSAHVLAGLVGRLTRTPVVATIHGMSIEVREVGICRTTGSHLVVVCEQALRHVLALGLPPARVHLIANGVDLERFAPTADAADFRDRLDVPPGAPLVGWVGRLAPEKGPDLLMRVADIVLRRRPDVHVAVVGGGPMADALRTQAHGRGIAERLHLVGAVEDTAAAHRSFDVLVQTSRSEGMPLVLLEAMASGVPVAAFNVGGVAEVVAVDETGTLAMPGDVEALAQAVFELLADPVRRRDLGAAARRRADARFDLRVTARQTADLFDRLVRRASPRRSAPPAPVPSADARAPRARP
jgi:glycosyltransferase involved in cell wall biosynthesis